MSVGGDVAFGIERGAELLKHSVTHRSDGAHGQQHQGPSSLAQLDWIL